MKKRTKTNKRDFGEKQEVLTSDPRGITLIALIITIIVMLILVSVSISIALNTGLFSKAGQAVGDMDNAKTNEQGLASGGVTIGGQAYNSIDEYLATNPGGATGETFSETYATTAPSKYSTDLGETWTTGSYEKSSSGGVLLTTGANENFKSKNIYDIAGNVWEWTTEAYSSLYRVFRGGEFGSNGSVYPASHRYYDTPGEMYYSFDGFRPTLYIK